MQQSIFEVAAYDSQVEQIVGDVFRTMLHLEPASADDLILSKERTLTTAIYFAGSWKGAVLLECTDQLAFTSMEALMQLPAPLTVDDDARDSLGELINMIGGNLKCLLPPGSALSMPTVMDGIDCAIRICGANRCERKSFQCSAGPFRVSLVEMCTT